MVVVEKIAVAILFTESFGQFILRRLVMVVKVGRGVCVGGFVCLQRHLRVQLVHVLRRVGHRLMTAVRRTAGDGSVVVVVCTLRERKKGSVSRYS